MSNLNKDVVSVENAKIGFKNFGGRPGKFTRAGDHNFCIFLTEDAEQYFVDNGYPVKHTKPRDPDDEPEPYMKVQIKCNTYKPSKVYMVTDVAGAKRKTLLTEEGLAALDYADIKNVDIAIRPYDYDFNGNQGRKAIVDVMYVTIAVEAFAAKYRDCEDSAIAADLDDSEPF